jgi:hypothetical protein
MIMNQNTSKSKFQDGITLFEESVLKPDNRLRQCARNQGCYDELMRVRERVLEFIANMRKEETN